MKNILKQEPLLSALKVANPKLRKVIINSQDPQLISALTEIILNLLKGNIPLTPVQKKNLRKYKGRFISLYKNCCTHKPPEKIKNRKKATKILVQSGGAFPLLLSIIAPLLAKAALGGATSAIANIAAKKILNEK